MSILQFIVDMKWVFTTLLLAGLLALGIKRSAPETRREMRRALLTRGWKAQLPGGFGLEASPTQAAEAIAAATAPDEEIARTAGSLAEPAPAEQVATIRRDAVARLMSDAAEWGWKMGAQGFPTPPRLVIVWQGEQAMVAWPTGTPASGPQTPPPIVNPGSGA